MTTCSLSQDSRHLVASSCSLSNGIIFIFSSPLRPSSTIIETQKEADRGTYCSPAVPVPHQAKVQAACKCWATTKFPRRPNTVVGEKISLAFFWPSRRLETGLHLHQHMLLIYFMTQKLHHHIAAPSAFYDHREGRGVWPVPLPTCA
ncbi:hypothetical protein CVT25_006314 [Psilocybe cyanescens]|uniref:Uncharacterized protein n=1 Tax=Psilocybe cyanescens TaxID=93625 RepID=A0A409WYR2_PSICY|nr:hypothetical protein CVT25_006314 [Psilocybe cyanescens]